jgi:CheY-like chemotaxis protein
MKWGDVVALGIVLGPGRQALYLASGEAIVRQARRDGAYDYLTKPLDLPPLAHAIYSELTATREVQ